MGRRWGFLARLAGALKRRGAALGQSPAGRQPKWQGDYDAVIGKSIIPTYGK